MQDRYPNPIQQAFPTPPSELQATRPPPASAYPASPYEDEFDLWEYWSTTRRNARLILSLFFIVKLLARRNARLILSLFFVAELLTLLIVLIKTPLYIGSSTILIESQAPQVLEPNKGNGQEDTSSFYKTQYEILKSRTLAASVIHALKLDKDLLFTGVETKPTPSRRFLASIGSLFSARRPSWNADDRTYILGVKPEIIDKYLDELTIKPEQDTPLVTIAFTNPDPVLASRIVNAHVQAYIQQGYELRGRSSEAARRFLKGQLGELEKGLEKSEAALNDYRRQRGIVAFSLYDKNQLESERMVGLNKALVDAEEKRIALQAEVETIKSNDFDAVPEVVNSSLIQNLKVELSRLQGQYANLSNQFTPEYPDVAQLHAQVVQLKLHEQQEIDRVIESIKARYGAALGRETELAKQLQDEKIRAMSVNDASLEDAILTREVSTNRALYTNVLERIKLLGVTSEAQVTNVSIIDMAAVPRHPSSPKKIESLALAGLLALMTGLVAAFIKEGADEGLKTADEVQQYLRLPNLATVPCFLSKDEKTVEPKQLLRLPKLTAETESKYADAMKRLDNGPNIAELPAANIAANGVAPESRSYGAAEEAYRAIRTSILLSCAGRPPKIVLFTSTMAGEGKTVTAINTAITFAAMFDRVLLIDGDLRRSRCHEVMNSEPHPGLAEVLSGLHGLEDAIQATGVKGLFLLSGGLNVPNPSELLGSKKMLEVLAAVGSSYDHILIDSAPILPVSDSVILSTQVDGVVIVIGSETPKSLVRDTCSSLFCIGAKILGVVLNNVDPEQQPYYAPRYLYRRVS